MAGAFQESGFQYTGFQMDEVVVTPTPDVGSVGRFGFAKIFEDENDRETKIKRLLVKKLQTKPDRPGRPAPFIELPELEIARALLAEAQAREREDIVLLANLILDRLDEDEVEILLLS